MAKLGAIPPLREDDKPAWAPGGAPAPAERCRSVDMGRSRRCAVKADCVTLIDAETGPRHALLGKAAWETLDSLSAASGERLSPCKRDGTRD